MKITINKTKQTTLKAAMKLSNLFTFAIIAFATTEAIHLHTKSCECGCKSCAIKREGAEEAGFIEEGEEFPSWLKDLHHDQVNELTELVEDG